MQIVNCDDSVSDVSQLQTHLHCRISQSSFFFFFDTEESVTETDNTDYKFRLHMYRPDLKLD